MPETLSISSRQTVARSMARPICSAVAPVAQDLPGALFEAREQAAGIDGPLLGRQGVGVHDEDDPVLRELLMGVVERLDAPHDGGLAGPRVADQEEVAELLPLEVLEDGHGDIAQRLLLADDALGQVLVDLDGLHGHGSLPLDV